MDERPPVSPVPPVGVAPPAGYAASDRLADAFERTPPPGQQAVVLAALMIGLLLMGIQLWLLTVALELYLAGAGRQGWSLALVSGLIFLGGVLVTRRLGRRPRAPAPGPEVTDLRADW